MRGKWFAAAAFAVVLIAVLIVSKRFGANDINKEQSVPTEAASVLASPNTISEDKREPATVVTSGAPKTILVKPADPEFQNWLAEEAKSVDHTHVDSQAKQIQIRKIVSKLTPTQSRQLLQTASNPVAPAGEKILSTYLMVEGGLNSREELKTFISAPLKDQGPHDAHSEGEMNGIREKSLRIMAIDGLFSQAKNDPQAHAALAQAAAESTDPSIKSYAEQKLKQLAR